MCKTRCGTYADKTLGREKRVNLPNGNMVDLVSAPEAEAVVTNEGLAWPTSNIR
jgi:hypothetical protein